MAHKLEDWSFETYPFTLPLRFKLWGPKNTGVVVCLHGFQDHALSMMKRIGWWEQDLPFQILAVNAPFPVPIMTQDGYQEAYAWYFRDTERNFTIVSPQETAERVAQLIRSLNLSETPSVIFGFSQGGYLAPFLAPHLKNLRALIGLGSGYPIEVYAGLPKLKIFALHGDQDERIPIESSREAHALLVERGFGGEFRTVPGLGHRVEPKVEPLVRRIIETALNT